MHQNVVNPFSSRLLIFDTNFKVCRGAFYLRHSSMILHQNSSKYQGSCIHTICRTKSVNFLSDLYSPLLPEQHPTLSQSDPLRVKVFKDRFVLSS